MRASRGRPWIKIHTNILNSSINYELTTEEFAVFVKLITLAATCSDDGLIADNDGKPYPHSFISHRLFVDSELLERAIEKCIETKRIAENGSGIKITNWKYYQDEYNRQKPYRNAKKDEDADPDKYIKGKYGNMVHR